MAYRIEFTPHAVRQIKKLNRVVQHQILARIEQLAVVPRPHGVRKLSIEENLYRIRVGEYRVIYQITDKELIVVIVKIGHRREVYS